jgi:hypothetical protein
VLSVSSDPCVANGLSGVNTGKTTSLFNHAINNNIPIISIVHLRNLGGNQEDNFNRKCKILIANVKLSIMLMCC